MILASIERMGAKREIRNGIETKQEIIASQSLVFTLSLPILFTKTGGLNMMSATLTTFTVKASFNRTIRVFSPECAGKVPVAQ